MKKNERLSAEEKLKLIEPIISGELSAKGVSNLSLACYLFNLDNFIED